MNEQTEGFRIVSEAEFQAICSDLVQREVHLCVSYLVRRIIESKDVAWFEELLEEGILTRFDEDEETGEETQREAYEHWAVSEWLYNKLAQHCQMVGQIEDLHVWGRETTGQAIAIDGVIRRIVEETLSVKSDAYL